MPLIKFVLATTDATAGTAVDTQRLKAWRSIQFRGVTGGGSYKVQGSNDGTGFEDIGSAITTDQIVNLVEPLAFMRIYTTTAKVGATAHLSAHDVSGS